MDKHKTRLILSESFENVQFNQLFDDLYEPLCRYSYRYVYSETVAEDIVQDVFTYLYLNWKRLSGMESVNAYLYMAVKNKSINEIQRNYAKRTLFDDAEVNELLLENNEVTAQQQLEYDELLVIVERALEMLPERCRTIFVLKRFEEKTNLEVAEMLGISIKTVEAQMTIALKKLTIYINKHWPSLSLILFNVLFSATGSKKGD